MDRAKRASSRTQKDERSTRHDTAEEQIHRAEWEGTGTKALNSIRLPLLKYIYSHISPLTTPHVISFLFVQSPQHSVIPILLFVY